MRCPEHIRRLFEQPGHAGRLPADCPDRVIVQLGSPGYGEVIRLEIQLDPTRQKILTARFQAAGCGFLIATAEWTCRRISGLLVKEAQSLHPAAIAATLALPPAKTHCASLLSNALAEALGKILPNHPKKS